MAAPPPNNSSFSQESSFPLQSSLFPSENNLLAALPPLPPLIPRQADPASILVPLRNLVHGRFYRLHEPTTYTNNSRIGNYFLQLLYQNYCQLRGKRRFGPQIYQFTIPNSNSFFALDVEYLPDGLDTEFEEQPSSNNTASPVTNPLPTTTTTTPRFGQRSTTTTGSTIPQFGQRPTTTSSSSSSSSSSGSWRFGQRPITSLSSSSSNQRPTTTSSSSSSSSSSGSSRFGWGERYVTNNKKSSNLNNEMMGGKRKRKSRKAKKSRKSKKTRKH